MKLFIFAAFLISLSYQLDADISYEFRTIYPLRAFAVLHGETKDPLTNQSYSILGSVGFLQWEVLGNVTVTVEVFGLPPHNVDAGLLRGLHIHTYGILNVSADAKSSCGSTGPHFNPLNDTHGSINSTVRHFGDLGNVLTFKNGTIRSVYNVSGFDLYGPYSVIGRSVVLHEGEDDYGMKDTDMSRSAGSSGVRIACGVIGLDKSESGSVENGFLSYYMMSLNVSMNKSEPAQWLSNFFNFEDKNLEVANVHDVIDELEDETTIDSVDMHTDQALLKLFSNYLRNISVNDLKSNGTRQDQQTDVFAELRRKLFKLL